LLYTNVKSGSRSFTGPMIKPQFGYLNPLLAIASHGAIFLSPHGVHGWTQSSLRFSTCESTAERRCSQKSLSRKRHPMSEGKQAVSAAITSVMLGPPPLAFRIRLYLSRMNVSSHPP